MDKPPTPTSSPTSPPAPAAAPTPSGTNTDPGAEVVAVLLNLLRNANREVLAPTLGQKADAAVQRFRVIANDLATTRPFAGPLPSPPPPPPAAPNVPATAIQRRGA